MLRNYDFLIEFTFNGEKKVMTERENEFYRFETEESDGGLNAKLIAKRELTLKSVSLVYKYDYKAYKVYVNGYQSWTTSREYSKTDRQRGLLGLGQYQPAKYFVSFMGDYDFCEYKKCPGFFHSFSYGYIKKENKIELIGSLNERTGYTILYYDMNENALKLTKDVEGVTVKGEYEIFSLYYCEADYDTAFDGYFSAMKLEKRDFSFMCGYTSWYNYYSHICEEGILRDLDGMSRLKDKAGVFQIDDGYQKLTGEWTETNDRFPGGLKRIADKIHGYGYKAGLWLAPLYISRKSKIAKEHTDWLLKGKRGKPSIENLGWGGVYSFDIYNSEARAYIKNFFDVILNDFGFDMVKLDFLYGACRIPRLNRSRGQLMCEAMDFLRECVGDKILLGCGVPLVPAFGKADYCRISSDVEVSYTNKWYANHTNQEIVSAKSAMNNSIFRRHLNGRVWGNDPDVFFLRDNDLTDKDEFFVKNGRLNFNESQKALLARINNLFGSVLFVSDNIGGYTKEQLNQVEKAFTPTKCKVLDAEYVEENKIAITYLDNGVTYKLTFDTLTGVNTTDEV